MITVPRGWTDFDNDRVVDCNLAILTANGECAALTGNDLNFGGQSGNLTQVNPDTLRGWGVRDYDWQWSIGVQHELLSRVSVDVAYARRSFHSFTITDNQVRDSIAVRRVDDHRTVRLAPPWRRWISHHGLHADAAAAANPGTKLHHLGD